MAWAGIVAVTVGVLLHLPMYLAAADDGYRLAGMDVDAPMLTGMVLIFAGLGLTAYGLFPRVGLAGRRGVARVSVRPLDDAPINAAHVGLLLVMAAAVTIDVMKPTTLAFVIPGFAGEYGLRSQANPAGHPAAALLPLAGIAGTVIGSLSWGWLGDRIGRRASILLAGVLFAATAICGSMPSYQLNLVMCFVMGLGVGGMLPIVFTLIAETIPSRHRGWLMVLIGGDVAGAYILTSWLSATLVPEYSWRILWLIGLPTGLLLIVLNRWIPESPRFLLAHGRTEEARAVMARYGADLVPDENTDLAVEELVRSRFAQLFQRPLRRPTAVVVLLGLGIGLVSFGFQLWIPTNLRGLGYADVTADRILRDSALIGFPLNFVVAALYGLWSAKKTIVLLAGLTAASLFAFAVAGDAVADDRTLLNALLVVPIWGISSMVAVLAAYSSEVYPTRVRSRGSGLAAAASKAGGVVIIAIVVAAVAPPTITGTALIGAIPMALAALAAAAFGIETRKRRLEQITAQEFERAPPVGAQR
ncbi:MAG: MFS transporter [Actinomycetota bacterium]|nr:MFS transporter [Actinomycetota bacterium]MDP8967290.1 MFS transporter [Actinomycetota bacterium]